MTKGQLTKTKRANAQKQRNNKSEKSAHKHTIREIIYTDTKKDDSSLLDEQEAF